MGGSVWPEFTIKPKEKQNPSHGSFIAGQDCCNLTSEGNNREVHVRFPACVPLRQAGVRGLGMDLAQRSHER
ncbi:MAG: hypothetical protein GXO85_10685 [Chlorobi bacterium]|nr:hypothetical protein [Chlorobiota bacterium]